MAETVTLPVVGTVPRRVLLVGGAVSAGVIGYAWWRYSVSGGTDVPGESSSDDASYAPEDTGVSASPGSYVPVDVEQDAAPPEPPKTNQEWVNQAVERLTEIGVADAAVIAAALGKYIAGQALTTGERAIVTTARAVIGPPPTTPPTSSDVPAASGQVWKAAQHGKTVDQFINYWRLHWLYINPKAYWKELVRLNPNIRNSIDSKKRFRTDTTLRIR
jgi:hypothetical protein